MSNLCVKMVVWEDQFTGCYNQSSLSTIGAFTMEKTRTNRNLLRHSCTLKATFRKEQQTKCTGLGYALRKINM